MTLLSSAVDRFRARAERVAVEIGPLSDAVDRDATWPTHAFAALRKEDLLGLNVPERLGGHGQGLQALAVTTEEIARACPSSAICFAMHCVGTAVIASRATKDQEDRYLRPIAAGRHITTLAVSETGTGVHFYMPQTKATADGDSLLLDGTKQFVTNGGHADSYVVSVVGDPPQRGEFSCVVVEGNASGLSWLEPWHGLGMRGNSSRGMRLDAVRIPTANLLGAPGEHTFFVFEVLAPYFLVGMAATYLGLAQAALTLALDHVRMRRYTHGGESLADVPEVQGRLASMWIRVERTRALVHHAATLGDLGDPGAPAALFAAKADVAETAVTVTDDALRVAGGSGYRDNARLGRLLRDARAVHVMSPTTDLLQLWIGRSLLGLPLL